MKTIYDNLVKEAEDILHEIRRIDKQLETLPKGDLSCTKNGKYVKWYYTNENVRRYIPKQEEKFAKLLAKRKYLTALKKDLEKERRILLKLIDFKPNSFRTHLEILESAGYAELLKDEVKPHNKQYEEWMEEHYETNTYRQEGQLHDVGEGLLVRSKAEAMIVAALRKYNIPFRYECICYLGKEKVFPDFTIIHPKSGKLYYWEHLGKMSDCTYYSDQYKKLKKYNDAGIVMGINLIITTETKDIPLNYATIEHRIKEFFL